MLFNSWQFILYYIVVFCIFFSVDHKWRIYLLLASSIYFYTSWRWEFGLLMIAVSTINFYIAKNFKDEKYKGWWLLLAFVLSFLPLLYYKYGNFIITSVNDLNLVFGYKKQFSALDIILPVGISFFTFEALSYSIDVYYKKIKPEPRLVNFLTFVAFFPKLVAGPIERADNIIPQFNEVKKFSIDLFLSGAKLFIWGLFKKVVIADRLALYVDPVFNNPELYSGPTFLLATILFTFQIYCDFSGYSDMAIGIARTFGFKLMQNFNLPYLSKTISEFWKKWHISLSTWFGDYLYKPLGGNRVSISRWMFNIIVVFLVSGLWHGANWTFVIWGALHGTYYLLEYFGNQLMNKLNFKKYKESMVYTLIKIPIVFVMVSFAWIFFRANSVSDAFYIVENIFSFSGSVWLGSSAFSTFIGLIMIVLLLVVQILQYNKKLILYQSEVIYPVWLVGMTYIFLLIGISLLGVSSNAFIYFQF